jgi:hypothetical protein
MVPTKSLTAFSTSMELWIFLEEFLHEGGHVLSNLLLVGHHMGQSGLGEACTDWLVNVKKIGIGVPGVWV